MLIIIITFLSSLFFPKDSFLISNDTIKFTYEELKLLDKKGSLDAVNGKLVNGSYHENLIYGSLSSKIELITGIENFHYCLLLGVKNNVLVEGYWNLECFFGQYKKYHKNGQLSEIGEFANPYIKSDCYKIGNWHYYNKKGKLIKEENYDENGKLIETINY